MPSVEHRVVSASGEVRAEAGRIFDLIADPSRQPEWDGNDNLAHAAPGQRVRSVGDVFTMTLAMGSVRENHVVEFDEGRVIAWKPAEPGRPPVGHLWRWEVQAVDNARSIVVHTYDWTELRDESRYERARATTSGRLAASIDRLAAVAGPSARPTNRSFRPQNGIRSTSSDRYCASLQDLTRRGGRSYAEFRGHRRRPGTASH